MKTDFSKVLDVMSEVDAPETVASSETERRIEEIEKRLTERLEATVNNAIKGRYNPANAGGDTNTPDDGTNTVYADTDSAHDTDEATDTADTTTTNIE